MAPQDGTVYFLPCKPGSAYVNVTDACLNNCLFCIKRDGPVFYGSDLSLSGNGPSVKAIMEGLCAADARGGLAEIVFCGMGEPLLRYDCVLAVCKAVREDLGAEITLRVDTSGLTWRQDGRLDLVDDVNILSISLNAETPEKYDALCIPKIPGAYQVLMDFLSVLHGEEQDRRSRGMQFPEVRLSVVDTRETDHLPLSGREAAGRGGVPVPDFEKCEAIAAGFGWPLVVKRLFRDSRHPRWDNPRYRDMCFGGDSPECCKDCCFRH